MATAFQTVERERKYFSNWRLTAFSKNVAHWAAVVSPRMAPAALEAWAKRASAPQKEDGTVRTAEVSAILSVSGKREPHRQEGRLGRAERPRRVASSAGATVRPVLLLVFAWRGPAADFVALPLVRDLRL